VAFINTLYSGNHKLLDWTISVASVAAFVRTCVTKFAIHIPIVGCSQVTPAGKDENGRPPTEASGLVRRASSLLDFVAAVVLENSGPPELAAELGAVGEAARWTNAALVEALAAVDRGLEGVREERAACTEGGEAANGGGGDSEGAGKRGDRGGEGEGTIAPEATDGVERRGKEGDRGEKGEKTIAPEATDGVEVGEEEDERGEGEGPPSERSFARRLGVFMAGAEEQRGELVREAEACRQAFQALAEYLGEAPATAAPEVSVGMRSRGRRTGWALQGGGVCIGVVKLTLPIVWFSNVRSTFRSPFDGEFLGFSMDS
jgi:hypothetical protein